MQQIFCTLQHIACQRVYVIYDAIIYSKRPILKLRPLPSNNELSVVEAHYGDEVASGIHI